MNFVHCLGAILIYGRNISQAIFKINTLVCNLPLPQKKKKKNFARVANGHNILSASGCQREYPYLHLD